jgi:hypothetical protein
VRPLISDGIIPRSKRCSALRHMGRKSAKELISLAPFSQILFYLLRKYPHRLKCHNTNGQVWLYPSTQGLPGLWLASISHRKKFHQFSFFEKFGRPQQLHPLQQVISTLGGPTMARNTSEPWVCRRVSSSNCSCSTP